MFGLFFNVPINFVAIAFIHFKIQGFEVRTELIAILCTLSSNEPQDDQVEVELRRSYPSDWSYQ